MLLSPEPELFIQKAFLQDGDALFAYLRDTVEWDTRIGARKTATFGKPYNYSRLTYAEQSLTPELARIAQQIADRIAGFVPNNCLLNFYESGENSMGFHSDATDGLAPGTGVAIVSLGAERDLTFRNKADKAIVFAYPLPSGSLLYMGADVQNEWMHAIKKAPETCIGGRISLMFRQIL